LVASDFGRTAARIFSAVFSPIPGSSDSTSAVADPSDSSVANPPSTSLRIVLSPMPASV